MKKSGTAPEIIIPLQLKRWSGKSPVLGVYGSEAGMRERDACLRNKLAKLRRCALRKPGKGSMQNKFLVKVGILAQGGGGSDPIPTFFQN